jgi:hypothetical protein
LKAHDLIASPAFIVIKAATIATSVESSLISNPNEPEPPSLNSSDCRKPFEDGHPDRRCTALPPPEGGHPACPQIEGGVADCLEHFGCGSPLLAGLAQFAGKSTKLKLIFAVWHMRSRRVFRRIATCRVRRLFTSPFDLPAADLGAPLHGSPAMPEEPS